MIVACPRCEAVHAYASADVGAPARCPACGADGPVEVPPIDAAVAERFVPRGLDRADVRALLAAWVHPVWFRTPDLDASRLTDRLVAVWWPWWLVDVDADGQWQIEAGYDYPVESSQEVYAGGRWTTRKVTETRTRWEPRVGKVSRRYDNVAVPALADQDARDRGMGPVDLGAAEPWTEDRADGPVRLPDRSTGEQWPVAVARLRDAVGRDCARASGADHVRGLFLDLGAADPHWSRLLVPGFTTWYDDDGGVRRVVLVHGVTGKPMGPRLASEQVGARWARIWVASGSAITALGLILGMIGLVVWVLLPVAALIGFAGVCVALVALVPWLGPARWNRGQVPLGRADG